MSAMLLDLRHALRLLRTRPGFTLLIVLTLALGIGANAALFSVIDAVWLRALPSAHADRLVAVWLGSERAERVLPDTGDFELWRQQSDVFERLAGIAQFNAPVGVGAEADQANVGRVAGDLFGMLGEQPLAGRLLLPSDDTPDAPLVAVVSERFFRQRLGGNPEAIGQAIRIGAGPATTSPIVVGVLPERFSRMLPSGVLLPAAPTQAAATAGRRPMRVVGLLRPGLSAGQAHVMLEARPTASPAFRAHVVPLRDSVVGADVGRVLTLLFGAVGLLLFIACVNVANLLLARLADREREMAVRAAVGASHWRLARQLLTESLVLAGLGAAGGLLLASIGRPLLVSLLPARTPGLDAIAIDARVLAFTVVATVVAAVVAGLWPVLRLSRARADQVFAGRVGAAATRAGGSRALLAVEVALALTVIVAAGALVRSFVSLMSVDPGFRSENVIVLRAAPPPQPDILRGPNAIERWRAAQFGQSQPVLEDLERRRTVDAAGIVSRVPLGPGGVTYTMRLEGQQADPAEDPWVGVAQATAGYFEAMGIPLRRGRLFTEEDRAGAPAVLIVSDAAARRFWPGRDPIGTRVFLGSEEPFTIIGIVGDVRQQALAAEPRPDVYQSWLQRPDGLHVVVRTSDRGLLRTLSASGATIGGVEIVEAQTLDDHVTSTVREPRARMMLFVILGAVVLLLTVVGVAGLTAHIVSRRTREAGIRLALGARPREILTLMIGQSAAPIATGVVAGWMVAWWASRFMESFLFQVEARDPWTFAAGTLLLMVAGLGAAWLPARRAARLDPAVTLRQE